MRGSVLEVQNLHFKPRHVLCQLGSRLDNIDGVEAMFLEPTFRTVTIADHTIQLISTLKTLGVILWPTTLLD
jgi:hypothetical protein